MMNHTDGWMGGRRNVGLDGHRRGGGCAVDCRDCQNAEEIVVRSQFPGEVNDYVGKKNYADKSIY